MIHMVRQTQGLYDHWFWWPNHIRGALLFRKNDTGFKSYSQGGTIRGELNVFTRYLIQACGCLFYNRPISRRRKLIELCMG